MKIEIRYRGDSKVAKGYHAIELYSEVCRSIEDGLLHHGDIQVVLHRATEVVVLDLRRLAG